MKILLLLFTLISFSTLSQPHEYVCSPEEIAFDGNDLVSYFEEGIIKGTDQYSYTYDGLNLRFASKANLEKFKANPEKYIPAYNGYCAIALTSGNFVRPDFNHFKIQDGKLLFFEVRAFFNGKTAWERDPQLHKIVADAKYRELTTDN